MPIEIREIVIKTEVRTGINNQESLKINEEIQKLKRQLKVEVKKMLVDQTKRNKIKR